jgi:hypothetical protein
MFNSKNNPSVDAERKTTPSKNDPKMLASARI